MSPPTERTGPRPEAGPNTLNDESMVTGRTDIGPLRQALADAAAEHGVPLKDLTVLAVQNDPFRIDTPAGHRDGAWLAMHAKRLGLTVIHLRGLHYALVTASPAKPNGEVYRNTDKDWTWLQEKAADAARWLGYIRFDRIVDHRNAAPEIRLWKPPDLEAYISVGVKVDVPDVDDIEPQVMAWDNTESKFGFRGEQPYKLVLVGEKSSLEPTLGPIAAQYQADLYLPTGEASDSMIHGMARVGAADGRPMIVFYFADCDPAGWQMPVSVARKLQALKTLLFPDLDFEVHRVALIPGQVREYRLPSTPLKDTEKRADAWQRDMGVQQTEIDALASLQPQLLRRLAREALDPFYDHSLDRRVHQAYTDWRSAAQEIVDEATAEDLDRIRGEAAERLSELREQIEAINDALRIDASDFDLPPMQVPAADLDGKVHPLPLLDSGWPFVEQCRALIDSKAYRSTPDGAS